MKKWILRIGIVVVVLLIAGVVAGFLMINSIVKTGVETVGPKIVKVDMKLESANISPLSGSGQLHNLVIGNPEGYKTPDAIKVGDIKVNINASSLLTDTIVIESVNIQNPEITFEGGIGGNNLSKILDNLNAIAGNEDTKKEAKPSEGGKKFTVKDLVIQGGKINASITGLGGKTITLPLPPLHLQNIGAGGGVSAAELSQQILKPLLASVTDVVTDGIKNVGEGVKAVGKGATEQIGNATKGIKGIFKK